MTDTTPPVPVAQRGAQGPKRSLTEELTDPDSATIRESLTRRCDQCRAGPGEMCVRRGGYRADLTGRLVHLGRLSKA